MCAFKNCLHHFLLLLGKSYKFVFETVTLFKKKKKITHFCLCTTPQFSIPGFEIAFGSTSLEFSIWLPKGCWCKKGETVFFPQWQQKYCSLMAKSLTLTQSNTMLSVTQDISESWEVPTNKQKLMWLQKRPWRTISRMETFLKSMSSRLQEVTDCKDFHQTYIKNYISLSK